MVGERGGIMEIVINIDDKLYEIIKNPNQLSTMYHASKCAEAVRNGVPLPKGHGKLIDAGLLDKSLEIAQVNLEDELSKAFDDGLTWASEVLNDAPTIIEADKGE
jgi:hypothetical protein